MRNFAYLIAGAMAGAAAAMLMAPQSGCETRKYLKDKVDEGADYLKHQTDHFSKDAIGMINRGNHRVQSHIDRLRGVVAMGR